MKISITSYGATYSVETENDDINIQEVVEKLKGLLVSAGFHPNNVDEHFNTEYQWFEEQKISEEILNK